MKRYRTYLIVLAVVTVWGIFAYAYLGVEDGSSGLSLLGWLNVSFFIPGIMLLQKLRGSHGNADIPLVAGIGWMTYTVLALGIAHAVVVINRLKQGKPNK